MTYRSARLRHSGAIWQRLGIFFLWFFFYFGGEMRTRSWKVVASYWRKSDGWFSPVVADGRSERNSDSPAPPTTSILILCCVNHCRALFPDDSPHFLGCSASGQKTHFSSFLLSTAAAALLNIIFSNSLPQRQCGFDVHRDLSNVTALQVVSLCVQPFKHSALNVSMAVVYKSTSSSYCLHLKIMTRLLTITKWLASELHSLWQDGYRQRTL